jgi:hypothetical protein
MSRGFLGAGTGATADQAELEKQALGEGGAAQPPTGPVAATDAGPNTADQAELEKQALGEGGAAQPPTGPVAATDAGPKGELPAEWPHPGYDGSVQPWEASNPPELTHDKGLLTSGEVGEDVIELCALLARLGFQTSIARGQNPHAVYDESIAGAILAFRQAYGIRENPEIVAATIPSVVGPWTWEALIRAADKADQEQE